MKDKLSLFPYTFLRFIFLVVLFSICFTLNAKVSLAATGEKENISFKWAFGALQEVGGENKLEPIDQDRTLKSGDKVKMLLELQQKCFIYVIHHGPQGEVSLLFPYRLDQFTSDYETQRKYYIPKGNAWLQLDEHPGRESFYLIASEERLNNLESLLNLYESAEGSNRAELSRQIIAEIRETRRQHRELSAPAERPVTIGGTIRGIEKPPTEDGADLDSMTQEISSSRFYGKTYTIDHQ